MKLVKLSLLLLINLWAGSYLLAQNEVVFSEKADEPHYVLITMTNNRMDFKDIRAEVTKYVWRQHAADKLSISHILIGDNRSTNAILIESFDNKVHAMKFLAKLKEKQPDFTQMGLTKDYLVVSTTNYQQILRYHALKEYITYFQKNNK